MDEQNQDWTPVSGEQPGSYTTPPSAHPGAPEYSAGSGQYPPPPPGGYPPPPPSGGYVPPPPGEPPYGPPYGGPPYGGGALPPQSESGMHPNTAAAIAYLTFIPAVIFLVIDPYKRSSYVRFHAWQEIVLTCAGIILGVIQAIFSFIPVIHILVHIAVVIAQIVLFVFWIIAIINASKGVRYRIPVIGDIAESFAAKM